MTFTNFPSGITSLGVPVLGGGLPVINAGDGANHYYFVDSARGLAANPGTIDQPFNSLASACSTTYNAGLQANDVIVVLPGHTETVTAAGTITLSTAGVQIIGFGSGAKKPTLTFSTAASASFLISGASVKISNIRGVAGINSLTNPFSVTGSNVTLDIEWVDSTYEAVRAVLATSVSNLKLNLRHYGLVGGSLCVNSVRLTGATASKLTDTEVFLDFYGKASTSVVEFTGDSGSVLGVRVTGSIYNSGTTDGSKDVVDTATNSTWWASVFDGTAGAPYSGGSASALAKDDLSAVADALYGANGVATWPTAAAYANNVSIAEVLGYIQNAVRNGSGAALATNKSLVDALGTTGSAVGDSAVSVLGAIGADNANNAFASTSVVADADGSVLERLEFLQVKAGSTPATFFPGLGYKVSKTEDVNPTAADLFTVTGKVLITLWTGEVTNAIGAGVTDYKLRVKTDNVDLCAASGINGAAIGFLFQMSGDAGDTLVNTASATKTADTNGKGLANRVVGLASGSLTLESTHSAGDASDAIIHTIWYMPLEAGAAVAAA